VHAGRHREALENLQLISKFNGRKLELNLEDVDDGRAPLLSNEGPASYHLVDGDMDSTWPNGGVSEHNPNYHTHGESSANHPEFSSTSTPKPPDQQILSSESPRPRSLQHPSTASLQPHHPYVDRNSKSAKWLPYYLPRWLRKPFYGWYDRMIVLLGPEWFGTTMLTWALWFELSLGKISVTLWASAHGFPLSFAKHTRCLTCSSRNFLKAGLHIC
jgi:hypothetical protein